MKKLICFVMLVSTFSFGEESNSKAQLLNFEGSSLEGKEMRPSIELVVDPGEVFGEAVFIEPLNLKKIAERTISESLLEEIK